MTRYQALRLRPLLALFSWTSILGCTAPSTPTSQFEVAPLERVEVAGVEPLSLVGNLYLAGQPDRAAFSELKDRGVELVIDLRHPDEDHGVDEPELMSELDLEHVVLPISSAEDLTPELFEELRQLLRENADRGVLLHCASSNRVGATWMTHRILDEGVTWSRALAEARASGLRSEGLITRARDYVRGPSDERLAAVKAEVRSNFPDVATISVDALAERLATGDAPTLIDVREPAEFAVSHLPRAGRATTIEAAFAVLDGIDESDEVVVYCSVGYRSAGLARALAKQGFSNVKNLEGSIFEWANEGYPLERAGVPVEVAHPYDDDWGQLLDPARRAEAP